MWIYKQINMVFAGKIVVRALKSGGLADCVFGRLQFLWTPASSSVSKVRRTVLIDMRA